MQPHLNDLPDLTLALQLLQLHHGRPHRLVAAQEPPGVGEDMTRRDDIAVSPHHGGVVG